MAIISIPSVCLAAGAGLAHYGFTQYIHNESKLAVYKLPGSDRYEKDDIRRKSIMTMLAGSAVVAATTLVVLQPHYLLSMMTAKGAAALVGTVKVALPTLGFAGLALVATALQVSDLLFHTDIWRSRVDSALEKVLDRDNLYFEPIRDFAPTIVVATSALAMGIIGPFAYILFLY